MDSRREHYIIGRALYEAVSRLDRFPDEGRPQSDIDDMLELLNTDYRGILDVPVSRKNIAPPPPPILRLIRPDEGSPSDDN